MSPALSPGPHRVAVQMTGYRAWMDTVVVVADRRDTIRCVLERLTGKLSVRSHPSEAPVRVRDARGAIIQTGVTPLLDRTLETAAYDVEVSTAGYVVHRRRSRLSRTRRRRSW